MMPPLTIVCSTLSLAFNMNKILSFYYLMTMLYHTMHCILQHLNHRLWFEAPRCVVDQLSVYTKGHAIDTKTLLSQRIVIVFVQDVVSSCPICECIYSMGSAKVYEIRLESTLWYFSGYMQQKIYKLDIVHLIIMHKIHVLLCHIL